MKVSTKKLQFLEGVLLGLIFWEPGCEQKLVASENFENRGYNIKEQP